MGYYDRELAFTEVYRRYSGHHAAIREANCLKQQLKVNLREIRPGDIFAGRIDYAHVGFGYEEANGGPSYYCWRDRILSGLKDRSIDPEDERRVREMLDFWSSETTLDGKLYHPISDTELGVASRNAITGAFGRSAGPLLDFNKLLQLGLPGLAAEVQLGAERAKASGGDVDLYTGLSMAIQIVADAAVDYARQARALGRLEMADVLEKVALAKPETFREAIQLFWLYVISCGVLNYDRMDVYLGGFLDADLAAGKISETEALSLVQSLWRMIAERGIWFNMRVIVGGMGRPNEKQADRFAMLAMEATRTVVETEPQLTLRFYEGMDDSLMSKALDVIGEGRTFPMLYNDDVNVPAVQYAFNVSRAEAEQYLPYGCGEFAIDHLAYGSPNSGLNALKALEAVLHNGHDGFRQPLGLALGAPAAFETFDDLYSAYKKQVEYHVGQLARLHALEYEIEKREAAYLFITLLYDGCIEKGLSVVNGGARYIGGVIESVGVVNTADSLTAIKLLVYDKRILTLERLVAALDANFEGYEAERLMLLRAPKYGNDDPIADEMVVRVSNHLNSYTRAQAEKVGLDYFLEVNINNYANVHAGRSCAASADGRKAGTPLANANNPTAGMDKKGVTAFLSSLAKIDPKYHAGYVQNMKFSKNMFIENRKKLEGLLTGYWKSGGTQAMITVVGREDLENAMREPGKYSNLMVRVGGFSARFVKLEKDVQLDILNRTLN